MEPGRTDRDKIALISDARLIPQPLFDNPHKGLILEGGSINAPEVFIRQRLGQLHMGGNQNTSHHFNSSGGKMYLANQELEGTIATLIFPIQRLKPQQAS